MANTKIIDYVSGLEINAGPEETQSVQVFSKILVEDYGYPKSELQTHPQLRVKSHPSDPTGYPIDIAVFEDKGKTNQKLKMIVENKRRTRKDGQTQLELYLKFSEAQIGIWYNGQESLYLRKIEQSGNITFEEIQAIPKYREKLSDIGQYRRKDLKATHNLKAIFQEIRGYLVANATGTTRDEFIAKQMIHLILCKIYDERFTAPNNMVTFRSGNDDSDDEVSSRIKTLFSAVKGKYKDVLDNTDEIEFDGKSLRHIISRIQNFAITETDRDIVSDAFETFIGYSLKGEQGQFFTPTNVIRLMIEIIKPNRNDLVIDPACGSGGFLVETLRNLWKQVEQEGAKYNWNEPALAEEKKEVGIKNIRGIDKDSFLAKVAKSYMAILGDGKGGIYCEDSLENPHNWSTQTQQSISLNKFDIILTNPPFGKNIKVSGKDKLNQYYFGKKHSVDKKGKVTSKIMDEGNVSTLFLERALQLLKDGGKLGIILPETYFHAPSQKDVVNFIFKNNNVFAVIDLPHNTFRPYNNAKCIAVFVQKNRPQTNNILMAVAEEMGHNHQGKPIYRFDEEGQLTYNIWDDIEEIYNEIQHNQIGKKYTFYVRVEEVRKQNILVPRYYWDTKQQLMNELAIKKDLTLVSIQELIDEKIISFFDGNGSPKAEFKGTGEIPYIRVKDIVNWQIYTDITALIPIDEYDRLYKKSKVLKPKDILYVRRGSYRIGSVAMVSPSNIKCILTREILVIRLEKKENKYGLTPEYLLYALSHRIPYELSKNKIFIDTTLPNIADRWKEVLIPIINDKVMFEKVKKQCEEIIKHQWDANRGIDIFRKENDIAVV